MSSVSGLVFQNDALTLVGCVMSSQFMGFQSDTLPRNPVICIFSSSGNVFQSNTLFDTCVLWMFSVSGLVFQSDTLPGNTICMSSIAAIVGLVFRSDSLILVCYEYVMSILSLRTCIAKCCSRYQVSMHNPEKQNDSYLHRFHNKHHSIINYCKKRKISRV